MNSVLHIYKDATVESEWYEPYDGPWPYAYVNRIIVFKDYNFYGE